MFINGWGAPVALMSMSILCNDSTSKNGVEIGEKFAQSILEGWLSYSPGSKKELDDNAINQSIDAFLDGLDDIKVTYGTTDAVTIK